MTICIDIWLKIPHYYVSGLVWYGGCSSYGVTFRLLSAATIPACSRKGCDCEPCLHTPEKGKGRNRIRPWSRRRHKLNTQTPRHAYTACCRVWRRRIKNQMDLLFTRSRSSRRRIDGGSTFWLTCVRLTEWPTKNMCRQS
jgi:hypothetical protein